jgi:hypothetical protein
MAEALILMDGAYAHLAACYKRTTDHRIVKLNGCLTPGPWLKASCLAGCFFQESLITGSGAAPLSDRSCSVQSGCLYPLPSAANGQVVRETVFAHGNKHRGQRRSIPRMDKGLLACRKRSVVQVPYRRQVLTGFPVCSDGASCKGSERSPMWNWRFQQRFHS